MRINKLPNWNGLLHYKESCLAYKSDEFVISDIVFERWFAIYDINKKLKALSLSPIRSKRLNFLDNSKGNFVFVDFIATKVDLYEENSEIYLISTEYFSQIDDFITFFDKKKNPLEVFELTWKVDYPIGG